MQIELTYARILEVVNQGDERFYRISVQLPSGGEWLPGLIRAQDYVTANGLIVGMWVNGEFMAFNGAISDIEIDAILSGATRIAGQNKWRYDWVQVRAREDGVYESVPDGRASETDGYAYNGTENPATATLGSGISTVDLPGTFDAVPMAGAVVRLRKRTPPEDAPNQDVWWSFSGTAEIDGECSTNQAQTQGGVV